MPARIVLLVTSPRLPVGLLTAAAWDLVRQHPVFAAAEDDWTRVIRGEGGAVHLLEEGPPIPAIAMSGAPAWAPEPAVATLLDAATTHGTVVWLAGPAGDPELARQLGLRLAREPGRAELELSYGSWDPPGARLLDAASVIDRLASPGGDPWKRQQTHASLAQYLLEECYEAYDAIEAGDLPALREELGDLLLQVLLHARLAAELPEPQRWSIDEVAGELVEKMIRRNPHVFAGTEVADVDEILDNWERIKQAEKPDRALLDGVALSQPALALAAKIIQRASRAGRALSPPPPERLDPSDPATLGPALLSVVAAAQAAGVDAEAALRRAALRYAEQLRADD